MMKSSRDERRDKRSRHDYKPKAYAKYENDKRHMEDMEDKERDRVGKKGHYVTHVETSSNYSSGSESDGPKLPKAYSAVEEKKKSQKKSENKKRTPPGRESLRSSSLEIKSKEKPHSRTKNSKSEKRDGYNDRQDARQKSNFRRKSSDVSPPPSTRKGRHSQTSPYSRSRSNSREKTSKFKDHISTLLKETKRAKKREEFLRTESQRNDDSSRRKSRSEDRKSNHKEERNSTKSSHSHYSSTKYNNVHEKQDEKRDKRLGSLETSSLSNKSRTRKRKSDRSNEFEENSSTSYRKKARAPSSSMSPSPEGIVQKRKLSSSDSGSDISESRPTTAKKKKTKKKKKKRQYEKVDTESEEDVQSSPTTRGKSKKKGKKKRKDKDKHKKKHKENKKKKRRKVTTPPTTTAKSPANLSSVQEKLLAIAGVEIGKLKKKSSRSRAPMSKKEYDKEQSKVRRVHDPDTGRMRLVRGSGEIIEEIVSRHRHREINKQATKRDGFTFERKLGLIR